MSAKKTNLSTPGQKRVENWAWIAIYGGLLTLVLGLFVHLAEKSNLWGNSMMWLGGIATSIGFGLIFWRSRM